MMIRAQSKKQMEQGCDLPIFYERKETGKCIKFTEIKKGI